MAPTVTFPASWKAATALEVAEQNGSTVQYRPVAFEILVDSPIFAGPMSALKAWPPEFG